ncbi:hypothetical protein EV380_1024 [Zhihengliuella halotolerans]|uniref:Uncharacterized protein n=1 Tax=Zhihengliuella halotolerans TaxID=370736 RepID=A0A4Q8ABP2_9MICC|nr:hypothetical protein EV380_1024 [Zhihengliuella halotolerans]
MESELIAQIPHLIGQVDPTFALLAIIAYLIHKKWSPILQDLSGLPKRVTVLETDLEEISDDVFYLKVHTNFEENAPVPRRRSGRHRRE